MIKHFTTWLTKISFVVCVSFGKGIIYPWLVSFSIPGTYWERSCFYKKTCKMWYDGWDDPNAVGSLASSRVSQLSVTFLHHMCGGGGGGGAPRISLLVSWCMSCPGPGHHQLHCHQTGREWMDSKIWRVGCPGLGQPYQDIIFRTYLLHIHSTPTLANDLVMSVYFWHIVN